MASSITNESIREISPTCGVSLVDFFGKSTVPSLVNYAIEMLNPMFPRSFYVASFLMLPKASSVSTKVPSVYCL